MKFAASILICFGFLFFACETNTNSKNDKEMKSETPPPTPVSQDLTKFGIADSPDNHLGGLKVGDTAPEFSGKDQNGNAISLSEKLKKGPVVLFFYRGYWCPVCNRYLSRFQEKLSILTAKGASVIAVTPETAENANKTIEKTGLSIPVISDSDLSIMNSYQVAFHVTEDYQGKIRQYLKADIAETNGSDEANLPVPATYIIGQDGKITYAFYNPDYKQRASVSEIAQHL